MIAVQAGYAPIIKVFKTGDEYAPLWEDVDTYVEGIRICIAVFNTESRLKQKMAKEKFTLHDTQSID